MHDKSWLISYDSFNLPAVLSTINGNENNHAFSLLSLEAVNRVKVFKWKMPKKIKLLKKRTRIKNVQKWQNKK